MKGIHIRMEEIKVSLFAEGKIVYGKNAKCCSHFGRELDGFLQRYVVLQDGPAIILLHITRFM